jgi:hypothetical protein
MSLLPSANPATLNEDCPIGDSQKGGMSTPFFWIAGCLSNCFCAAGSVGEPRWRFSTSSIFGWSSGVVHRTKGIPSARMKKSVVKQHSCDGGHIFRKPSRGHCPVTDFCARGPRPVVCRWEAACMVSAISPSPNPLPPRASRPPDS